MKLKKLHKNTDKILLIAASNTIDAGKITGVSKRLAEKYNVSDQTILNYIHGRGKDGFLKQLLIEDFKEINKVTR